MFQDPSVPMLRNMIYLVCGLFLAFSLAVFVLMASSPTSKVASIDNQVTTAQSTTAEQVEQSTSFLSFLPGLANALGDGK